MKFLWTFFFSTILLADSDFVQTAHTYQTESDLIHYTAITGSLPVSLYEDAPPVCELFFIAYLKETDEVRPITFIFPGGPGGACGPEAICSFGPRRLLTPSEGKPLLPPYQLIDNTESIFPFTDLVFVDPIKTGFSHNILDEKSLNELLSVEGDINALGNFVRSFVTLFGKWNAPKYLAGTSYGTTRSAGVASYLLSKQIALHGVALLGCALDFSTIISQQNRFLPDSFLIPTFAATAWFHGRLWPEKTIEEVVEEAKNFTYNTYIPNLFRPSFLNVFDQENFYSEMATLVGLPMQTVQRYQGRFDENLYTTEFFGFDRKVIGGLDSRYVGELSTIERQSGKDDPSYQDMIGVSSAFNQYLTEELDTYRPFEYYVDFSSECHFFWDFNTHDSMDWPDLMQRLKRTILTNPQMKVFIGSGYYDCRTPFAATEYCFESMNLPDTYRQNIKFHYYPAGHGFVFDHHSLQKLKQDLSSIY